jgi:hypothetical protein
MATSPSKRIWKALPTGIRKAVHNRDLGARNGRCKKRCQLLLLVGDGGIFEAGRQARRTSGESSRFHSNSLLKLGDREIW